MRELQNIGDRLLVIFDGHCGFCNRSVRWFLKRDRKDRLRFADSESPQVAALLARHGVAAADFAVSPNTILVVCHPAVRDPAISQPDRPAEQVLVRSDAVIAMLAELPRPWPAVAVAIRLFPRPLRDLGYHLVARWRYRLWGRLETCPIPTVAERERFL